VALQNTPARPLSSRVLASFSCRVLGASAPNFTIVTTVIIATSIVNITTTTITTTTITTTTIATTTIATTTIATTTIATTTIATTIIAIVTAIDRVAAENAARGVVQYRAMYAKFNVLVQRHEVDLVEIHARSDPVAVSEIRDEQNNTNHHDACPPPPHFIFWKK
jgi:Mg2+/Co2+ transporter CorB